MFFVSSNRSKFRPQTSREKILQAVPPQNRKISRVVTSALIKRMQIFPRPANRKMQEKLGLALKQASNTAFLSNQIHCLLRLACKQIQETCLQSPNNPNLRKIPSTNKRKQKILYKQTSKAQPIHGSNLRQIILTTSFPLSRRKPPTFGESRLLEQQRACPPLGKQLVLAALLLFWIH